MAGIGQGDEQRRDLRLVIAHHDGLRRDIESRATRTSDQLRTGEVVPLPRRGPIRAGHDDRLVIRSRDGSNVKPIVPRTTPGLLQQGHAPDDDVPLQRLRHVVHGQCGHADCGQRLHLDAGPCRHADLGTDDHGAGGRVGLQLHADPVEREGMAEGNELARSLRRADAGQSRGDEGVALWPATGEERFEHIGAHVDRRLGHRAARGDRLVTHVDHPRRPVIVEMGRAGHASAPSRIASYSPPMRVAGSPSGTTSSPFADARGNSCEEPWPPAEVAR